MRNIALAVGLFVCSLTMLSSTSAKALTPTELLASASVSGGYADQQVDSTSGDGKDLESIVKQALAEVAQPTGLSQRVDKKPEPKTHVVAVGDTLSAIARTHNTSWQRLYNKNTQLDSPDAIAVGQKITIPRSSEKLPERPVAAPVAGDPESAGRAVAPSSAAQPSTQTVTARGSSAGNSYYAGYCTWYAKSRRPDMPNNLGNAATWVARAAAQGFATGSTPRVGAIGQQGNHVVYIERVHANGTVTVSEMNYEGYGVVSSRTVAASTFMYIY